VQLGDDGGATRLVAVTVAIGFCAVWTSEWIERRRRRRRETA
jgi:hypothetical protein